MLDEAEVDGAVRVLAQQGPLHHQAGANDQDKGRLRSSIIIRLHLQARELQGTRPRLIGE